MNFKDDNQARKALEVMGFKFPDRNNYKSVLEQIDYQSLLRIRNVFKSEADHFNKLMDIVLGSVSESSCNVCGVMKYSYSDLPDFWVMVRVGEKILPMCDECKIRYIERFKKLPDIVKNLEEEMSGIQHELT